MGSWRERSKDWKLLLGWFLYGLAFYDASVRLGDQLDVKTRAIVNLKQEISARDEMIKSCQEKLLKHSNSQVCICDAKHKLHHCLQPNIPFKVGRVDRALVRNLIVGYVTADQSKRPEILRCLECCLFQQHPNSYC